MVYDSDTMADVDEIKKQNRKINILLAFGGLVLAVVIALVVILFLQKAHNSGADAQKAQSERVIREVGKLYLLPGSETPTVAKIQDADKLKKSQQFYQQAENGDYVLIYNDSRLAMLYRESVDKLVNVSPINLQR